MTGLRNINRRVVLASGSPRRRQILGMLGVAFEVAASGVEDEEAFIKLDSLDALDNSLRELAAAKAEHAASRNPDALVIGADTTVVLLKDDDHGNNGADVNNISGINVETLNKPTDKSDAKKMLQKLSGRSHIVITAVAMKCAELKFCKTAAARTKVFFRKLDDAEIEHYLGLGEYKDKAGAYAVQGGAMAFIDRIEGCYYNVMGLPVTATLSLFDACLNEG